MKKQHVFLSKKQIQKIASGTHEICGLVKEQGNVRVNLKKIKPKKKG